MISAITVNALIQQRLYAPFPTRASQTAQRVIIAPQNSPESYPQTEHLKTCKTEALQGVRVLDLTQHVAGPYCTKLLADFGADVIKVERPQGDSARSLPPFAGDEPHQECSLLFAYLNTNKKGITLDLKTATGKSLIHRLLADTDILVENFTPRVMPSLGLDYDSLSAIKPIAGHGIDLQLRADRTLP